MAKLTSFGPVFLSEWLCLSRRWQWYLARSVFVLGVLAVLSIGWWAKIGSRPESSVQAQAAFGRDFWAAMTATQLAVVLLVAPAATAGAICLDRARGTLAHVLATDLTSAEIVLGKLAARVVPVFWIVLCTIPILALESLLGGVDGAMIGCATLVTLGVAMTGCAAALMLSTWGTKTNEVLLATYAAWALWLVALPMWSGYLLLMGRGIPPPFWLSRANPVWLAAAPYLWPNAVCSKDYVTFFVMSLVVSAVFVTVAITQLRRGCPRAGSRTFSWLRLARTPRLSAILPGPSIDANPVLWREWHRRRPSRWAASVWGLYAFMSIGLTATLVVLIARGGLARPQFASIANGFQAGIGLLLLSIAAATSLAEERAHANLDVLLATPLRTRSIVWGKWCGAFRGAPIVAICPGVLAAALASRTGRWDGAVLVVALFLAYGAAVASLGLALATWISRTDLAVALSVAVLGGVTIGWLFVVGFLAPGPDFPNIAAGSPIIGLAFPTLAMEFVQPQQWAAMRTAWIWWILVYLFGAASLASLTLLSFNRCLGRMPETGGMRITIPREQKREFDSADSRNRLRLSPGPAPPQKLGGTNMSFPLR